MVDFHHRRHDHGGEMKADWQSDQAAGLRRLFAQQRTPQVIAFAAGREAAGRTALIVQTAAALVAEGSRVMVVDENAGVRSVSARLGVLPQTDLHQVIRRERRLQEVVVQIAPLFSLLPAARMVRELKSDKLLPDVLNARLSSCLRDMQREAEFTLIDCAEGRSARLSPLALAVPHVAVVVAAQSEAITHAYSLIKRLVHEGGRDHFQIVISRARNEDEAKGIFENMRKVAREHLGVRLGYLGALIAGSSGHLAHALRTRLPALRENLEIADGNRTLTGSEYGFEGSQFAIR